jgi:hypothetical protein
MRVPGAAASQSRASMAQPTAIAACEACECKTIRTAPRRRAGADSQAGPPQDAQS